jgi:hypothetical protein
MRLGAASAAHSATSIFHSSRRLIEQLERDLDFLPGENSSGGDDFLDLAAVTGTQRRDGQ